ncbi:MAG TPA: dihydrodipicolinate synthase family protein [Candidatus Eremiobacteraceae bacterium]|nr:dihydrodipicolinate synthase family protein [Candidatus Eremiobacteraceae bacterium]
MNRPRTSGITCASLTPLDEAGQPCLALLEEHCRWLIASGCDDILLLGTTGEANSFTVEERMSILEGVLDAGLPASRLMVGTGCCAVGDSVRLTRHAISVGVDRALVLPPFYYKSVHDAGVIAAYASMIESVADETLRVYLYSIPQFSGVSIGAEVIRELRVRYPTVVAGLKDSSGDKASTIRLCEEFGDSFDVLVGSESFLLECLAAGASGCVTATANAHPELISRLYADRGRPSAPALQARAAAARSMFESKPMIAELKDFTARRTGDGRWRNVRPPLIALDSGEPEENVTRLV